MDNMRKAEKAMIAFIERAGLLVDFEREIWKEPRDGGPYIQTHYMLKGWTKAHAYKRADIQAWRDSERKTPKPTPVQSVITYCSAHDAFDKAGGRIRAVARLLRKTNLNRAFAAEWATRNKHDGKEAKAPTPKAG
jgi:hypothetical protein